MIDDPENRDNRDDEVFHHDENRRVVITTGAHRRVRKVIVDENDYERKQKIGHHDLGGSD